MGETWRRRRTLWVAAAGLLFAAIVVDTVFWATACQRLSDGVRSAAAENGWTLSAGAPAWGGWPAEAVVTLPDVDLRSGPDTIPPFVLTAERQSLRLSALHPTVLTADSLGAQSIRIGTAAPVPFTAQRLTTTIDLTQHDPVRIAAIALEASFPAGPVRIGSAAMRVLSDGFSVESSGLALPRSSGGAITPAIDTLRFDARLTPPVPTRPTAIESASAWRSSNGRLVVSDFALKWAKLDAIGQATLTLDDTLQPVIDGQVSATGLNATLDLLAEDGTITRSSATAAHAMLMILSAPSGGNRVSLPVTLHDGVVTVARIPLLRVAPLRWD